MRAAETCCSPRRAADAYATETSGDARDTPACRQMPPCRHYGQARECLQAFLSSSFQEAHAARQHIFRLLTFSAEDTPRRYGFHPRPAKRASAMLRARDRLQSMRDAAAAADAARR